MSVIALSTRNAGALAAKNPHKSDDAIAGSSPAASQTVLGRLEYAVDRDLALVLPWRSVTPHRYCGKSMIEWLLRSELRQPIVGNRCARNAERIQVEESS